MKIVGTAFDRRSREAIRAAVPTALDGARSPMPVATTPNGPRSTFPNFLVPSVQARWLSAGVSWYTPQMVETIFRLALSGDLQSQWEMFDLMQATWPELSKCLNEVKDGVCAMIDFDQPESAHFELKPFALRGKDPTPEALRRRDMIEESLLTMRARPDADENDFIGTVWDILDARNNGIAVLETDWELRELSGGSALAPRATRWVHPSWYGYPFGPGNEQLWLKLGGLRPNNQWSPSGMPLPMGGNLPPIQSPTNFYSAVDFVPFPANKFIIAVCKQKSGHPLGGALLHIIAWYWAAMNFTMEWFLNFAQIFGQPFRWANYDHNLSDSDQAKLQAMLSGMGAMGWAMFPAGTQLEFKEAMGRAADNPQKAIIDIANSAARLLILRQSLTTDVKETGSRALGTVHQDVLADVKKSWGRWACGPINQLVHSVAVMNFGDDSECPVMVVRDPKEDDSKELSETLANLKNGGLQPSDKGIADLNTENRLSFEIERGPAPAPDAMQEEDGPGVQAASTPVTHPSDAVADRHAPEMANLLRGAHAPLREIILTSQSREECLARAHKMYADWKPQRVTDLIDSVLQGAAQAALRGE